MFRHLKAEEFVNLLEGKDSSELSGKRRAHLESCARCAETWRSIERIHSEISLTDTDILEPDWSEFRSKVRNELLSRSVQRASTVRRWTGWPVRPAAAWAFSILLAVGITSGAFLWLPPQEREAQPEPPPPASVVNVAPVAAPPDGIDFRGLQDEIRLWSQRSMFEEVAQLNEQEQERLRLVLQFAQEETAVRE
ncbi:MAG: hypothetical protein HY646_15425 [Acidobacteria bacterium]|nr:hypothetical protein [Acidobacteriota bacterium]